MSKELADSDAASHSERGDYKTDLCKIPDEDIPDELRLSILAFLHVHHGDGDQTKTPKNRIEEFLLQRRPKMLPATVERISTVANTKKASGRPTKIKK